MKAGRMNQRKRPLLVNLTLSTYSCSAKNIYSFRDGKINRKINTLSLHAVQIQMKRLKMHLTACCADLTKHKCTLLLYYSGGTEEGQINVRCRNGRSSHFGFANWCEAAWDNHQPRVSTAAEHRLPLGWAEIQHQESSAGQADPADGSAQRQRALTARQGKCGKWQSCLKMCRDQQQRRTWE